MYVQVAGAKDLTAYTKAYKEKVKTVQKRIEAITERKRKDPEVEELKIRQMKNLRKRRKSWMMAKRNRSRSLRMPKSRLPMERRRFQAKEKIASGKSQIAAAKQTIDTKQKELDQAKKTYQNGLKELSGERNSQTRKSCV